MRPGDPPDGPRGWSGGHSHGAGGVGAVPPLHVGHGGGEDVLHRGQLLHLGGTQIPGGVSGGHPPTPSAPPERPPLTSWGGPGLGAAVALGAGERWGHREGTPG